MESIDLREEVKRTFTNPEVAAEIDGSLLYLDMGAGEVAHCSLGLPFLYALGARAVCSLEDASPWDKGIAAEGGSLGKVVVVTTRALSDVHRHILRLLLYLRDSAVHSCCIFTALSEEAHESYPGTPLPLPAGSGAYADYEQLLVQDLLDASAANNETPDLKISKSADTSSQPHHKQQITDLLFSWNRDDVHKFPRPSQVDGTGAEVGPSESGYAIPGLPHLSVRVRHLPLLNCVFTPISFVFPASSTVAEAPLSNGGSLGPALPSCASAAGSILDMASEKLPAGLMLTAHWLVDMAAVLGLKLEVFGLGPTARATARLIVNLHPNETSGPVRCNASLVVIDRSLDLLTPACHHDTYFDRALSCLPHSQPLKPPHLPGSLRLHTIQRQPVDPRVEVPGGFPLQPLKLAEWNAVNRDSEATSDGHMSLMGGSLFHPTDQNTLTQLENLMGMRVRESAQLLRKMLREALVREGKAPSRPRLGSVTSSEIMGLVQSLTSSSRSAFQHVGLVQLACVMAKILDSPEGQAAEALASIEKIFLSSAGEVGQSPGLTLMDLVAQVKDGGMQQRKAFAVTLRQILLLSVLGYALAGERQDRYSGLTEEPFLPEEYTLKDEILEAILSNPLTHDLGFLEGLELSLQSVWDGVRDGVSSKMKDVRGKVEKSGKLDNLEGVGHEQGKEIEARVNGEGEGWPGEEWEDGDGWGVDETENGSVNQGSQYEEAEEVALEDVEGERKRGDGWEDVEEEEKEYSITAIRLEVRDRLNDVFGRLHSLASARSGLALRSMGGVPEELGERESRGSYRPLLKQLVARLLSRAEVPGLEHVVSGVGGFIKTGLGRLGLSQSKVRPADNRVIIFFVVGGIAPVEIKDVKEAQAAVAGGADAEILLGGTTLLTPDALYDALLGTCGPTFSTAQTPN